MQNSRHGERSANHGHAGTSTAVACCVANSFNELKGAMGEISNFYNLSARLLIFNTHISPNINTRISKFRSCLSDTF